MKKYLFSLFLLISVVGFVSAQETILDLKKEKDNSDKAIQDPKKNTKAATWEKRGQTYAYLANDRTGIYYNKLDSNALQVSYEAYQKARELGSKTVDKNLLEFFYPACFYEGAVNYESKNFSKALRAFEFAQKAAPDSLVPYLYASEIAANMKDYDKYVSNMAKSVQFAEGEFQKIQQKRETFVLNLAVTYISLQKYDEAEKLLNQFLTVYPSNTDLRAAQIEVLIRTNKLEAAITQLQENIKNNPDNADNYYNLGVIYEKTNQMEKADENYRKSVEKNPTSFDANFNLGALYYNKAAALLKETNEMSVDQYKKTGVAKENEAKANFEKALPSFEKLAAQNDLPNDKRLKVLKVLQTIYNAMKRTEDFNRVSKEIDTLEGY
ncbi:MAG: tetratricopeptide repeat protein [Cytophagales bacterium]|nr:MAG: tetratricopeptide repeat protein [Cytophagales bacterium]